MCHVFYPLGLGLDMVLFDWNSVNDLLPMPEIWIGDTAATTDMTPHRMGMTEAVNPQGDIHVVMGNKQVEKSTAVGCISSIVCDNQGNQKLSVKITDVALVPDCAFNLFSLSK